ncbi:MAG: hypothetical protein COV66_00835 [Nitrospinae bacterium CG11_big_fil_rev_8_21_14_0_20_45_15]|nr:MAG: hypothetical protein COV66_00835 [Nitrospinae bacterium CG11_big_fil_rev_8_21_14_0_20_45_15]
MTATWWLAVGFAGQALFGARFIIQWIVSEKKGESTIPLAFWYCSIGGSIVLLTYAIYKEDPVFIVGQSLGSIIYVRNLVLIDQKKRRARAAEMESNAAELERKATEMENNAAEMENSAAELKNNAAEMESNAAELESDAAELESNAAELRSNAAELRSNAAGLRSS